jgi:hypothetical protein
MSSKDAQAPSKRKKSSFSSLAIWHLQTNFFTNRGGIIATPGKFTRRGEVTRMRFAANLKKNLFRPWQLCYHLNVTMETRGPDNKLQSYFLKIVRESFWQLGIYDATVAGYVADVLAEFVRSDALYKFRSRAGRKEDSVVGMLARQPAAGAAESDVLKERSLRKYVGDYALFMSGIFRKHVEGSGALDYYIQEGSRSYWTVSELDLSLYRTGYFLYQELSKKFEYYSGALDYTRKAYFASAPGEDPFAGFMRQVEGWIKVNITEN